MCRHHLYKPTEGQTDGEPKTVLGYNENAGKEAVLCIKTALCVFLLVCKLEQRRNQIIYHDGAIRVLLFSSDAGVALGASMVHLVTGLSINGLYQGQTHTLDKQCFLSRINEKGIPFLELFYVFRNLQRNLKIITFVDQQGLSVSKRNTLTDSATAMLQLQSTSYNSFSLRINHPASKTVILLISYNLCPFQSVYFFNQKTGKTWHVDYATKCSAMSSDKDLLKWHNKLQDPDWMACNPRSWTRLDRAAHVPAAINTKFLSDLCVNPEQLGKVAAALRKLRPVKGNFMSYLSKKEPLPDTTTI